MKRLLVMLLVAGLAGCVEDAPTTQPSSSDIAQAQQMSIHPLFATQHDPMPAPRLLIGMYVYKLRVPLRTVSHDEVFWKHVDEQNLDIGTHDLLWANGFRVGTAPREDWDYFKKVLQKQRLVSQLTGASSVDASQIDMPLQQNVPEEFVAYFHPTKGLVGQIYDQCDVSMLINFESTPRSPGDVRITATPKFLSQRTEIGYTALNQPLPQLYVRPEYLFDLKLQLDVPLDHFLIIGPSTDADHVSSLGHKLLYQQVNGQEFETVLVIAPQPFRFEQPTTAPSTQGKPFAVQ
jgi:hypothetical protein